MAKPKRIGHLVINVKDVDASTKFYTEVLGFEISLERPGFGTFLTCGSIHHDLALFQAPEGAAEVTDGGLGLNHMAIQVEDFAELTDIVVDIARADAARRRGIGRMKTMPMVFSPRPAALIGAEPDLVYWLMFLCRPFMNSKPSSSPKICTIEASVV